MHGNYYDCKYIFMNVKPVCVFMCMYIFVCAWEWCIMENMDYNYSILFLLCLVSYIVVCCIC